MRSPWLAICDEFRKSTDTASFRRAFDKLKEGDERLLMFNSPDSLLQHQRSLVPGEEQTDAVLHSLIGAYQRGGAAGSAAGTLALLAMEPGLTVVFLQVRKLNKGDAEECAGDICLAFFEKLARWVLQNKSRIAANLQLTTLHRVLESRSQQIADGQRMAEGLLHARALTECEGHKEITVGNLWVGLAGKADAYSPDEPEIAALRRALKDELPLSNTDIELLVLRGPCSLQWKQIGERVGMEPESARRQHWRLRERWQHHPFFDV